MKKNNIEELINIINTKFLSKIDIELIVKNDIIINKNTGSIIYKGNY